MIMIKSSYMIAYIKRCSGNVIYDPIYGFMVMK